ncbi:unnamed protein product, partial [Heterosigma akashiwo]
EVPKVLPLGHPSECQKLVKDSPTLARITPLQNDKTLDSLDEGKYTGFGYSALAHSLSKQAHRSKVASSLQNTQQKLLGMLSIGGDKRPLPSGNSSRQSHPAGNTSRQSHPDAVPSSGCSKIPFNDESSSQKISDDAVEDQDTVPRPGAPRPRSRPSTSPPGPPRRTALRRT